MKKEQIILLAAAAIALNAAPTWAQSRGGTQSERTESGTPLPKENPSKAEKGPGSARQSQTGKDTSIGGSRSERTESDTPLSKGSRSAESSDPGKAGQSSRSASQSQGMSSQQDVRQAQEALKNQGHDPGPVDGVMGSQTRQALRAFQSKNGLKQTGMLDAETKQKLNIDSSFSGPSSQGSGSMGRGDSSTKQGESSSPMGK